MEKEQSKKDTKIRAEKVAVLKCNSYNQRKVDQAVNSALNLIDFKIKNNSSVLIKPNGVMTSCEKGKQIAITTHPSLIEAMCKILKKNNCKIYIGESSFTNTECVMKQLGYEKIAKKYNAKIIVFEQEKLIKIKNPKNKILKTFPVAKILKEVDYIIDMPKMKTHTLALATLGIKNLYGLIPGGLKQRLHNKAHGKKFSEILVDIYQNFEPHLTLMDAIVGMDGEGPASGDPKKANLILASKNTVALDICASRIMGYNAKEIDSTKIAVERKFYPNYEFNLVGMKKLPIIKFRKPKTHMSSSALRSVFKEKPIVCDHDKCIKCGTCAKHCPAKAITLCPFPVIDRKKCIRCFCCMEICPVHALSLAGEEFK